MMIYSFLSPFEVALQSGLSPDLQIQILPPYPSSIHFLEAHGMDKQFPNMANATATPRHVKIALCILHLRLIFTYTSLVFAYSTSGKHTVNALSSSTCNHPPCGELERARMSIGRP